VGAYNVGSNYKLRDSVILNNRTMIHVINDRLRFVDKLRPSNDFIYAGIGLDPVKGIGTVVVTI
jgi:hypothetical protein